MADCLSLAPNRFNAAHQCNINTNPGKKWLRTQSFRLAFGYIKILLQSAVVQTPSYDVLTIRRFFWLGCQGFTSPVAGIFPVGRAGLQTYNVGFLVCKNRLQRFIDIFLACKDPKMVAKTFG